MLRRFVLCLLILLPLPALAERRVALVMAAEEYRALRPLGTPVKDALAVEEMLAALGFEVTVETDRDLRRMRRALEDFRADYAGADVALIYFAGHGVEIGGLNYLLPVDGDATSARALAETGLPLAEVQAALAAVAPVGIVLLDACREDPFAGDSSGQGRAAAPLDDAAAPAPRPGLGRIGRADGVLFAFSAAPGQVASDGQGDHSPFAEALLRHFATPGVEVRTALTLVQQDVYDRSRGRQLPYVESGLPRLFFAAATADLAADLAERDRLLIAMADLPPGLRAEVEALAAEKDMPLAPLFGALMSAGLQGQGPDARAAALVESAEAFLRFRAEVAKLSAEDPAVAALRAQAEAALVLGEYDTARTVLAEAARIDGAARDVLRDNYRARTLSQAQTLALSAQAGRADLDYGRALADLAAALALYDELEGPGLAEADRVAMTDLMWDQGDLYRMTGASLPALAAYRRWGAVAQARVAEDPAHAAWARNAAVARVNIGDMLAVRGDLAAAEAEYRAALVVAEDLSARPDAPVKWRHDLFVALSKVADVEQAQGDLDGALALHAQGLAVLGALAGDAPDRADIRRDLAVAHDRLGDLRRLAGDLAGARGDYEAALAIRRDLRAADPGNTGYAAEMGTSLDKIGDLLLAEGDAAGALAVFRDEVAGAEALAARDPGNAGLRRDLSAARLKLGDALQGTGDGPGARAAYAAALEVRRALAASDPDNAEWQRDLATIHERLGTLALLAGDLDGAEGPFRDSLQIARALVARDPSHAGWQRDLTIALDRLGDLAARRNDWAGAEALYSESFALTRALAAAEPGNAERQLDLVAGLARMSIFAADRRVPLEEARDILIALQADGRIDPARLMWRALIEDQLKSLP